MPRLKPVPKSSKVKTRSERFSSFDSNTDNAAMSNTRDYRCYGDFYALAECNKNVNITTKTTSTLCRNEEKSFEICLKS
jgi:hypothetical protein